MKKTLVVLFWIISTAAVSVAQELPPIDGIKFEGSEIFKVHEPLVLQTADYLLTTPVKENDIDRLKAVQFLIKWMEGTPDHTFTIDGYPTKYFSYNVDLMSIYMAALCKVELETKHTDANELTLDATKVFLKYVNEPTYYKSKLSKDIKRLSAANDKGELKSFLRM
ncbi:hypothetical protein EOD41_08450 [Mucilaginibacter limnophilus]|uniref:Uncharacterized protein n=1 Tax=Mucilaginibacter limnophilus TaxID=1932778 RepID=A0A437MWB5_9SPHI|nr:hypothetical protein [Mucilaginibacter limnophilus]RVU01972.1 hypothetical protein EOD41_08450 [Mucilaginibacter limnophilus]